jgi:hypothetical protein
MEFHEQLAEIFREVSDVDTPPEQLHAFATSENEYFRLVVAQNPALPDCDLRLLANDDNERVRAVARWMLRARAAKP